jgi:23S rRNA (cytosine1962-C5)-methyltransferase
MTELSVLRLKKNEERRLRAGHLWVFSNEVDTLTTPLKSFSSGDLVEVQTSKGESLGVAYVNPDSLIAARILSRNSRVSIDIKFFKARLERALNLRLAFYSEPFYRLVFGESDGLPGLIVDRFNDIFVLQTNTMGMERLQPSIIMALEFLFNPKAIILKNTSGLRELEGMSPYCRIALGQLDGPLEIIENDAHYLIDPLDGQKTGWFFDHRENRKLLASSCSGKTVLDLFSYTGAWSIPAALSGATQVDCVDVSRSATELLLRNAELNNVDEKVNVFCEDVFDFLKRAREEHRRYDVVIVDPPAFIKRKKDVAKGLEAYRRLNQAAIQLLSKGGILVSASCSFHLEQDTLHEILRASARHLDRHLVFTRVLGQGPDHPIHPAIPETNYLKSFFCHVAPSL